MKPIAFTPFDAAAAAKVRHFETYNRTPAAQRVADIVSALGADPGAAIVATGDAALAALLASAVVTPRLAILDVGRSTRPRMRTLWTGFTCRDCGVPATSQRRRRRPAMHWSFMARARTSCSTASTGEDEAVAEGDRPAPSALGVNESHRPTPNRMLDLTIVAGQREGAGVTDRTKSNEADRRRDGGDPWFRATLMSSAGGPGPRPAEGGRTILAEPAVH